jgi:hypothetical protein
MAHLAGRYANGGRLFLMKWGCAVPANSNNKWTPEEDKRFRKLQAAGKSSFLIAAELRRSVGAAHGRLSVLKTIRPPSRLSTTLRISYEVRFPASSAASAWTFFIRVCSGLQQISQRSRSSSGMRRLPSLMPLM